MKRPIKLFNADATNFSTCKNIMSECLSAVMTENIDGNFCIEIDYPLFDNKGLSRLIDRGLIIKCSTYDSRPDQLFKIRKRNRSTGDKKISIYAEAIVRADLDSNIILGVEVPAGKTRKEAIGIVLNAIQDKRRTYNVGTKDTNTNASINMGFDENGNIINYLDIAYISPLKALIDESENSIYKAYGGEIEFNNFEVNMLDERGKDNKFTIRSGKNLSDLEEEISDMGDDFATALIMCSSDGLYLPNNEILYSSYANQYDRYFYKVISCSDVCFEDLVTENSSEADIEQAKQVVYEQLRERGQKYFNEQNDRLFGSYKINFVELAKSEEYKDYAELTHCSIGNKVTTIYPALDLKVTNRVTEIKYNILTDKIEEITVGQPITHNIADTINSTQSTATTAKDTAIQATTEVKKTNKKVKGVVSSIEDLGNEIKLTVKKDEFGSMIDMHYDEILLAVNNKKNGTDVTITADGLSVYKGKFRIYDEDNKEVFGINQSGRVRVFEMIKVHDNDGSEAEFDTFGMLLENSKGDTASIEFDKSRGELNINCDNGVYVNGEKIG